MIAATNRADILDPALMRSGRLDRKIEFPHPTEEARARILQVPFESFSSFLLYTLSYFILVLRSYYYLLTCIVDPFPQDECSPRRELRRVGSIN